MKTTFSKDLFPWMTDTDDATAKKQKRVIRPIVEKGAYKGAFLPVGNLARHNAIMDNIDADGDETEVIDEFGQLTDILPDVHFSDDDEEVCIGPGYIGFTRPSLEVSDVDSSDDEYDRNVIRRYNTPMPRRKRTIIEIDSDEGSEEEIVPIAKQQKEQGKKVVRYCFTWNNPSISGDEFQTFLDGKADVKMAVFQLEKGNQNETTHFQGYLELNKRMYTTGVQSLLSPHKMTLLHANGTKIQNGTYCTKDGRTGGPWFVKSSIDDYKRKNGAQGKRTDLDTFAGLVIAEGGITEQVRCEMPGHVLAYNKHAKQLLADIELEKTRESEMNYWIEQFERQQKGEEIEGQKQRKLELYFGPTAVGKTTQVKLKVMGGLKQRLYVKDSSSKWWGNYNNELHVLLDEYKGGQTIDQFKAMTNAGEVPIEGKGTELSLKADALYFTSNCHPSRWWKRNTDEFENWNSPDYRAVARRFETVYWWKDAIGDAKPELVVLTNPGEKQNTIEWKRSWAKWQSFWEWRDAPGKEAANADNYFTL